MNNTIKHSAYIGLGMCMVAMISGCKPFDVIQGNMTQSVDKKKIAQQTKAAHKHADNDDVVLLKLDGDSVLRKAEFEKYLTQMMQANPYFRTMTIDTLPPDIKRKVFDRLVDQRLIVQKAKKMNMEEMPEFKKSFDETSRLLRNSLLVQIYEKAILEKVQVDDSEIKDEFKKNKEKYIKVAGGPLVEAVKFSDKKEGEKFFNMIREDFPSFAEKARAQKGGEYHNFARLSQGPQATAVAGVPERYTKLPLRPKIFLLSKRLLMEMMSGLLPSQILNSRFTSSLMKSSRSLK